MDKKKRLEELKEELKEFKKRNPSHCHGRKGFIDHNISVRLFQRIEDIEDKIKKLEKELK